MQPQSATPAPLVDWAPHPAFPDVHAADPQRPAYVMVDTGRVVTYGELVAASRQLANLLWSRGLRHGDCVAILMENCAEFLEVAFAAQRIGLRYVALPTGMPAKGVEYILDDSTAVALITTPTLLDTAQAAAGPSVRVRLTTGTAEGGFENLFAAAEAAPVVGMVEREGLDLLYSSGTTGKPKGVVAELTLAPLGTPPGVATTLRELWGFDGDTVYLSPAPLYHSAPLRFSMTVLRYGGTVVIMSRFDEIRALELIERHRITHAGMVPTMLVRIMKVPGERRRSYDLSSLKAVIHGAAPCPVETKQALVDWLGPVVYEYYSSTENFLFTALDSEQWLDHPGSVGLPLAGTPHILDDDGAELPPGEVGTIWSENGLRFEYLGDPEKTAASRNDRGWTTVGDLGWLDEDGFLYLSSRRADLVLSGGVNVYPQEAEDVLLQHPDVADAAVFGIPHEDLGEVLHAVVQLREGVQPGPELEQRLLAHCAEHLARFKCPRRIEFAAELPRQATGKLFKRLLRDQYRSAVEGH